MPCDSRIVTKLTDGARLVDALREHGYKAEMGRESGNIIGEKDGRRIAFEKTRGGAYDVAGYMRDFASVARKYAEIGVAAFARRRGYGVTENDGTQMTLINRRG
jgi:hypothetical protein